MPTSILTSCITSKPTYVIRTATFDKALVFALNLGLLRSAYSGRYFATYGECVSITSMLGAYVMSSIGSTVIVKVATGGASQIFYLIIWIGFGTRRYLDPEASHPFVKYWPTSNCR